MIVCSLFGPAAGSTAGPAQRRLELRFGGAPLLWADGHRRAERCTRRVCCLIAEQILKFIADIFDLFGGVAFQQVGIEVQSFELFAENLHDVG